MLSIKQTMKRIALNILLKLADFILPTGNLRKIRLVRQTRSLFVTHMTSNTVTIHGHSMYLDNNDSLGLYLNQSYEPFETQVILQQLNPGDVVVDIGANIGYYTLIMARKVGDEGKVFAFEPDPSNFALLKKNIETNGYNNIIPLQKAVSDYTQDIKLFAREDHSGDHRIYDPGDGGRQIIDIEAVSLDNFFRDFDRPIKFIKMDIQGAEEKALLGMSRLIKKQKELSLITEFWPTGLVESGSDVIDFFNLLKGFGFTIYQLDDTQKKITPANTAELLKTYPPDHLRQSGKSFMNKRPGYTNLLCIKE